MGRIHVDSTWILRWYVKDQISTNFHDFPEYFFDLISMVEKSMSFPLTFSDAISMVLKSTLFRRALFDVISMVEKSALFPRTFIGVISLVEKSTLFPRTFFDVICLVEICTLFLLTFFDVILMGKNSTSFLVSYKLMKTSEKVFPVIVTLNSWFLQDCSPWCSLVPLKFESYNLHHCKKNCCKLVFLVLQSSYSTT